MKKIIQALLMCIFVVGYSVTLCAAQLTPRKDAKKQLWGYVDENNNWVVKPKFDTAGEYTTAPNGKQRATVRYCFKKCV